MDPRPFCPFVSWVRQSAHDRGLNLALTHASPRTKAVGSQPALATLLDFIYADSASARSRRATAGLAACHQDRQAMDRWMDYQRRIGPGRPLSSPTRPERGGPLDVLVEPRTAPLTTAQPGFRLTSARSSVPGEEPAGNSHAGPDLACEVLLAQPNLAALAPRELGGRLRLGHGLCPGRGRLGFGFPPRAGLAGEQHAWRGRIDAGAPISADPEENPR